MNSQTPSSHEEPTPNIAELICNDLERTLQARRRHFAPALGLAISMATSYLAITGLRDGFWDQPSWQIVTSFAQWAFALFIFPAIGIGLFFPSRLAKIAIAVAGVSIAVVSGFVWTEPVVLTEGLGFAKCAGLIAAFGLGFTLLGSFSGAFEQRNRKRSILWLAAGIGLAAQQTVAWHCPNTSAGHVLVNHFGLAFILMAIGTGVGVFMHRRRKQELS